VQIDILYCVPKMCHPLVMIILSNQGSFKILLPLEGANLISQLFYGIRITSFQTSPQCL